LIKIVSQLLDAPLHGVTHILRGLFQFAAGDREYTVISIGRVCALARMVEFVKFCGIYLGAMLVSGVARFAALGTITEDLYDSIFDINVKGLLFTVQKALPLLPDGASIILNASIVASKGLPANSVYSATKAAIRSFARTWTTDLKDRRIRVNAVSPGSIDTPGLSNLLASSETGQQRMKMISNAVPLGRLGTPDEIAKAVVFLASDDSSYVTGTELFVDGGFAQV